MLSINMLTITITHLLVKIITGIDIKYGTLSKAQIQVNQNHRTVITESITEWPGLERT